MPTVNEWFDDYGESHMNPVNKLFHWVCVPLIMFSLLGFLSLLPSPVAGVPFWTMVFAFLSLTFYFRLSVTLGLGMLLLSSLMVGVIFSMQRAGLPVGWISLGIFAAAWIGQFIGHAIEGKRPSFFKDLQFLLIGPLWLMGFVYRKMGWKY